MWVAGKFPIVIALKMFNLLEKIIVFMDKSSFRQRYGIEKREIMIASGGIKHHPALKLCKIDLHETTIKVASQCDIMAWSEQEF